MNEIIPISPQDLLNAPVRIHRSLLALHPSAKLWYLCRAADQQGRGRVLLSPEQLAILDVHQSTIYRWLKEGREVGFFRIYEFRSDGNLYVSLAGLPKVSRQAQLLSWGSVTTVPLREVIQNLMRSLASAIQAQDLQEKSRYAAGQALNALERRCFRIPSADQVLSLPSLKLACGEAPGLVHVGDRKIFVGRSFIPFGASQKKICEVLSSQPRSCSISEQTLRNHLKRLEVERCQIVQAKPEYKQITSALRWESAKFQTKGDEISFHQEGDRIRLNEPNGKSSARREGGHLIKPERFFRYMGADWIYRCNLYKLNYEFTSMKAARRKYKCTLKKNPFPIVENLPPSAPPQTPQEGMPSDRPAGASLGNQNKEIKNKNAQTPEPEVILSERAGWLAMGDHLKAIAHQKRLERIQRLNNL